MTHLHALHRPADRTVFAMLLAIIFAWHWQPTAIGQSVCLPAPRLLTTMPMGGQAGTTVEVTLTGQDLDDAAMLRFSDSRLTATPITDDENKVVPNRFAVNISDGCPEGIYEASVMTRLGLSAPRIFSVSRLPEVTQAASSLTPSTAMPLEVHTICNATIPDRNINHYSFQARKGQRYLIQCAAKGIDSKANPVIILADAQGSDLIAERRGGTIDFRSEDDGTYLIKVHELTFKGGAEFFYRLAISEADDDAAILPPTSTRAVNAFSWPPTDLAATSPEKEIEPNDDPSQAQRITLPCDLSGSFAPAADVDRFEFAAKKGEVWWIEVASERLGRPTDPTAVVQWIRSDDGQETATDVAELSDIPSPVKVSGNNYAYDGPPYNAGSSDILGKIEIPQDGLYRLQLSDAFGGTRDDPRNVYRLVIRQAAPDFSLVAWAMHMELRNGDRNALSKPIALRGGSTMALEVVAIRRDGFEGEINLAMTNLPDGVTAQGLTIPAGQSRGIMLITADEGAPRGATSAEFYGEAEIDGKSVRRSCRLASMAWPVTNHWGEIPSPRLIGEVAVSVGGNETAPITIASTEDQVFEATQNSKLTIPLIHMKRSEFSGATMSIRTMGFGFDKAPKVDLPLNADTSQVVLDLSALKTPPGNYTIAFYGGAVAKYRANEKAKPKDIVDIIVSEPIAIRVLPAETK